MITTRMERTTLSQHLVVKPLVVYWVCLYWVCLYWVCLLFLTGCDQVKFKPIHGDPQPAPKAQPRVVVNTPAAQPKKQRTSQPRSSGRNDDVDQDEFPKFETTSEFSFDTTSFGASTFSSGGSGKHTSNHPVLATDGAIKLVDKTCRRLGGLWTNARRLAARSVQ